MGRAKAWVMGTRVEQVRGHGGAIPYQFFCFWVHWQGKPMVCDGMEDKWRTAAGSIRTYHIIREIFQS